MSISIIYMIIITYQMEHVSNRPFLQVRCRSYTYLKQGDNSNLDCVPRTAVVAMSEGGGQARFVPKFGRLNLCN